MVILTLKLKDPCALHSEGVCSTGDSFALGEYGKIPQRLG